MAARIVRALRGFDRIRGWRRLVHHLVPYQPASFVVENGGIRFSGRLDSLVDREVYLFGGYESRHIRAFLDCVPPSRRRTALDVGANVGTHTLAFAGCFRTVHSFEPNPRVWPQLEKNVFLNAFDNVTIHRVGLGDRNAELTLYDIDKPNLGLGTFSTVEQYDLPLRPTTTCPVRHAAELLEESGVREVDAVKIDVQGFELEVLRGLMPVLERDRPVIWCEIGKGSLEEYKSVDALSRLLPFSFRCLQMESGPARGNKLGLTEKIGKIPPGNYVLVPVWSDATGR